MEQETRNLIEALVRQVITERFMPSKSIDSSGIIKINLPVVNVGEEDRLNTGNAADVVYTKDLVSLKESPRLGCGLMVMEKTTK